MKFRNIITLISLTAILTFCGEKDKDDRIVLSSQSTGNVVLPDGPYEGSPINEDKFKSFIVREIKQISQVYDISMENKISASDLFVGYGSFTASFTVKTVSGAEYKITCYAFIKVRGQQTYMLHLEDCGNADVRFSKEIQMPLNDIIQNRLVPRNNEEL